MSGSNPLLKETKATFTVINEKRRPAAKVEINTDSIAGKSVSFIPQSKYPKSSEIMLTVKLVIKVKTIMAWINLLKLFVFPENRG